MNDERKTTIEVNMTDDEWIELLCLCEAVSYTHLTLPTNREV